MSANAILAQPVIIESYFDEDFEETRWRLRCPHCRGMNAFREVEKAVRWSTTEDFEVRDGRIVSVLWDAGDGNFEHDHYECEHCDLPVTMEIDSVEYRR